jgi:glycosyltransferase involved in cell wall biosynthesis
MMRNGSPCELCKNSRLYNIFLHRCIKQSIALSGIVFTEAVVHHLLGSYERNVDAFVVPSLFYKQKLTEWGWDEKRFIHIPNFINAKAFEPNFYPGKAFLYFGRLSPEKGLRTFLKAAALAKVPVWIAGTGSEEAILKKMGRENGAQVEFLGYISGDALRRAVSEARATVLPSEWYENAPLSVLESYALGKPVLGADIGGIPELVRDGATGTVFRSGCSESLASALDRFANMPDSSLIEMGRHGRAWIESDFTAERYRERLSQVYAGIGVSLR